MSTAPQTTPGQPGGFQGYKSSSAPARPKLVGTLEITGLGDPKDTGSGTYSQVDLQTRSTRGTQGVFPRFMFRPEMISFATYSVNGTSEYQDYKKYPNLAVEITNSKGAAKKLGESLSWVYRLNILPNFNPASKKPLKQITPYLAIGGGTLESATALGQRFYEAHEAARAAGGKLNQFGLPELTAEEIVEVFKAHIAAQGRVEIAVILKQQTDMSGALKDTYEVDEWVGPFTQALHDELTMRAERTTAKNADEPGKQLKVSYRV